MPQTPTGPLRILAVTNLWPVDGSFRGVFVAEQVRALRALGHTVDVEVVAQQRGTKDYLFAAPRIRAQARAGAYDVVHVHYGMTALAARLAGVGPRVLSLYGSDINDPRQRRVTRLGWGGSAARIYVSSRLAASAGEPDGRVIPNGVDFSVFAPVDRDAARERLGIAPGEKVVLFGGLPTNQVKGYDVFSDVLAQVREGGTEVRELILAGKDQPVTDVVAKYAAADVLLFTSRQGSEGSPTVVKEATAMGLPVVSVDVGDVGQVLSAVTPSVVVEFPPTRDELVRRLAEATAKTLRAGLRSNGRERNDWLDSVRIAERVVAVYREVAPARGTTVAS